MGPLVTCRLFHCDIIFRRGIRNEELMIEWNQLAKDLWIRSPNETADAINALV